METVAPRCASGGGWNMIVEMSLLILLEMKPAPEHVEEVKRRLVADLPETREFDGCESLSVHESQEHPGEILFVMRWASIADHDRYVAWRQERGELQSFFELLTEPPVARHFDDVSA